MSELWNWVHFGALLARYFLYRLGFGQRPDVSDYYDEGIEVLNRMFGWWRKTRIVNADLCPRAGPAIVAGNHLRIDDPFVGGYAIYRINNGGIRVRAMMRDDFFKGFPSWTKKLCDPEEITQMIGAIPITRGNVDRSQLDPFIGLLRGGEVFLIYPGRSRSRSGQFIEYRDWIKSPGATSYFPAKVEESCPGMHVGVFPMVRTYNPVSKRNTLIFGKVLYLPAGTDREAQRAFDNQVVVAMSDLVEINVPQVLCALLGLHCLHGGPQTISFPDLCGAVRETLSQIDGRYVDPAAIEAPEREVARALRYLQSQRMLRRRGDRIELYRAAILVVPTSFARYRKENPLSHLANQILHFTGVTRIIEATVLRGRLKEAG